MKKTIFICARNLYRASTDSLASRLQQRGFDVRFAAKDTKDDGSTKEEIYNSNLNLIKSSDVFLAFFSEDGHYGIDFATEVGKASELGMPVIGYVELSDEHSAGLKERLEKDTMFKFSFDRMVWNDFEELVEDLKAPVA